MATNNTEHTAEQTAEHTAEYVAYANKVAKEEEANVNSWQHKCAKKTAQYVLDNPRSTPQERAYAKRVLGR